MPLRTYTQTMLRRLDEQLSRIDEIYEVNAIGRVVSVLPADDDRPLDTRQRQGLSFRLDRHSRRAG